MFGILAVAVLVLSFASTLPVSANGASTIINGSFETGDYSGWTLVEDNEFPDEGTWGIAQDGDVVSYNDSTWDFCDEVWVNQYSDGLPITYYSTDGNYLAYQLQNFVGNHRMYQDVALGPDAARLTWDMWYTNWAGEFYPGEQYLAVNVRDPSDDSIIETLFITTEGVDPESIPMTAFSRDISAYAGTTVRLDIEMNVQAYYLDAAFDNFAIGGAVTGPRLFMVDGNNNTIYELDPSTGAVLNAIPTPTGTDGGGDGLAYGYGRMFFTTIGTNIIYEIDPSTGDIISQLERLPKVAVYGAEEASWNADVQAKLTSTGLFSGVDAFLVSPGYEVPTLAELQEYDAVLVYSDIEFGNSTALGDVLADYIDAGGGVVVATYAFYDPAEAGLGIGGRISTGGYLPFSQNLLGQENYLTLVADDSGHPILDGVTSFNGGLSSVYSEVSLAPDAYQVAHWSNDVPLIAVKEPMMEGAGLVVGLNFFPVSSDIRSDFWDSSTDGALLMANSLLFAGHTGETEIDALGFSGDALYALQYGDNATIRVLDPDLGATITILRPGVSMVGGLTFAGTRDSLFVSSSEGGEPAPSFGMTNQGFESADFEGWNVYTGSSGDASVVTSWASTNGTNYTAESGGYFALLVNGAQDEDTYISQNFTVNEGDVIGGWAFFSTEEDPIVDPGFNDQCSVDIMDGATLVDRVFYADTLDANWPDTPWTHWSWAANSTGTYTLVARVVNVGDGKVYSYMGLDFAQENPITVYEIDAETGEVLNSLLAPIGSGYGLYGLGFSSSRNTLFLGFYESNIIYEVDPDTGEVINSFAGPEGAAISALAADEPGAFVPTAPDADFHASDTLVSVGQEIYFFDDSTGTYDSWYWEFGDGGNSTEQNPTHAYISAGNYTVSLTVGGSGNDTETKADYITVLALPEANFHADMTTVCAGTEIDFFDDSTGVYDTWFWEFGDGTNSTAQNPSHAYNSAGTYTVSLTVSNACGQSTHTRADYITVRPLPEADFYASNIQPCANVEIGFFDDSTGTYDSWYWDFGDGSNSTAQNPYHTYVTAGTYTVSLTVGNGCGDDTETKIDYITVLPLPQANFHASDTNPYVNVGIDFFDDSTGTYDSWYWDFGDGSNSTAQSPSHTYATAGNYTVSLTVSNGCGQDTETKENYIEVAPQIELPVDIDIMPGIYPNSINLRSGKLLAVAIHTTSGFDASTVDPETVELEGVAPVKWQMVDVLEVLSGRHRYVGDGDQDLLLYFDAKALPLTITSTEATLTGQTYGDILIVGTDSVQIVKGPR